MTTASSDSNTSYALINKLDDELNAVRTYLDLAESETDAFEMQCLISIAQDEYQHAQFLYEMINENGTHVPESTRSEMQNVRAVLKKFRKL